MGEIKRSDLFGKLNALAYRAIESATVFCKMRGNPYVELVHWLHQILELQDSDLHHIVRNFNINPSVLAKDITERLDQLPRGSTSITDLSFQVQEAVERGWVYATLLFGDSHVRTGYLVVGMLKTPGLKNVLTSISREFEKVNLETLTDRFDEVVQGSSEDGLSATDGFQVGGGAVPGEASGAMAPAQMGKGQALARFSIDLTESARQGKIDPVIGRDREIRQIVDILMRRRQNNPILTGEAGVGKTAVVEGFALRIAADDVPPSLHNVSLRTLDVGLLQAGASMKGEFENRLRQVIDEVKAAERPTILFIDEAHMLIGAGGAAGTGDAANLLKPALARGELRTIAATTWGEYKKHFEKDAALTRRFQVVQVLEPDEEKALRMMRGLASTLEKHHRVLVLDEALEAAVKLSHRYIPARQLPDKSISLLDTAAARVAVSQSSTPVELDDSRRRIEDLETEMRIVKREHLIGRDGADRQNAIQAAIDTEHQRREALESRWEEEKTLVDEILEIRGKLRIDDEEETETPPDAGDNSDAGDDAAAGEETPPLQESTPDSASDDCSGLLERLGELDKQLAQLQGVSPLVLPSVDESAVASVVSDWTGIPVGRMVKNEIETVLGLADILDQRVVGQKHALEMLARRVETSRAQLDNPNKPIGVFMLVGPSGVGKTETALALAESLYGGEQNIITINMSEFQEKHTVSTLKGAPPGYVGYGEGGILTEAVRRRPYSVVLLDEIEKAHSDVHEIFFQVFDKGQMEDAEGRLIDFRNTLILLTSNVGTDLIANMCEDPALRPDAQSLAQALRQPLLKVFPAALLGRLVAIPYYPLSNESMLSIARLQLERIERRIREVHDMPFTYDDQALDLIIRRCQELESGARMIDNILTNTVLPKISRECLTRMMDGLPLKRVHVNVVDDEFEYEFD